MPFHPPRSLSAPVAKVVVWGLVAPEKDASWVLVKPDASEPHFHVHAEAGSPEEAQRLIANFRQRIEKLSSDTYAR